MKAFLPLIASLMLLFACEPEPTTLPPDMRGVFWQDGAIQAQFWIPDAEQVALVIYGPEGGQLKEKLPFTQQGELWQLHHTGDYEDMQYTLAIRRAGNWTENTDPYVRAVSINGERGVLLDFAKTNPEGWATDEGPGPVSHPIVYEVQVRDFSSDPEQHFQFPGKFKAFTERGLVNEAGQAIGIDHLVELGITHVHILPFFDFASIDETLADLPYNWGYDPLHFNAVEGTFATDASDPATRIRECKEMIQVLHQVGIGVVMDVVYNHTSGPGYDIFEHLAPGYFFRHTADGSLSNASACGNETASEKEEMRQFMLQSLQYWAEEYHMDGFRFDLMAIHDVATMRTIEEQLLAKHPNLILYGEGWTAGASPIPNGDLLLKCNTSATTHIAAFSDEFRNGLKGNVFNHDDPGFVGGDLSAKANVQFGLAAACAHEQIDLEAVTSNGCGFWAERPEQCMAYASCHDNHTIYDKLHLALPAASHQELILRSGIAQGLVLTSLGRPFLHAGGAMGRTKQGVENSYQSPDSINTIRWNWKAEEADLFTWVKTMVALRKTSLVWQENHPLPVADRIHFLETDPAVLSYLLKDPEGQERIWVTVRVQATENAIPQPEGDWELAAAWPSPNAEVGMWVYQMIE